MKLYKPFKETELRDISEVSYYEHKGYFCSSIVFSPETENDHFEDCPPYIRMSHTEQDDLFFRVPESVALYGKVHAGYTMRGRENAKKSGRRELQYELREILGIDDHEA